MGYINYSIPVYEGFTLVPFVTALFVSDGVMSASVPANVALPLAVVATVALVRTVFVPKVGREPLNTGFV